MKNIKSFFFLFLILILMQDPGSAKIKYIITLKGGTKIKADSFQKEKDVIKVFKYGGYIIYPLKNIKNIKKVETPLIENSSSNIRKVSDNSSKTCNPEIKYIKSIPVYNRDKNKFDIELKGEIYNGCPKFLKNVYLIITYYSEDNSVLFHHKEFLNDIPSYESLKFHKKIKCEDISKIKYFNYKLEFMK